MAIAEKRRLTDRSPDLGRRAVHARASRANPLRPNVNHRTVRAEDRRSAGRQAAIETVRNMHDVASVCEIDGYERGNATAGAAAPVRSSGEEPVRHERMRRHGWGHP